MRLALSIILICTSVSFAKDIKTNAVNMTNAPEWLNAVDVEEITGKVQYKLEWSTRRVNVKFFNEQKEFEGSHSLGPTPYAVTRSTKEKQVILMGPKITKDNFAKIFGHELVHVIFSQKYEGSIPEWLEEGLANHLSAHKPVDYKKLASQPFPEDVRKLTHPYSGDRASIRYHYVASQALAEMLEKKCDLENLIRLSVERKMADYIKTYCEITDINRAFQAWVKEKAK
jgi:hypothetical protein